MKKENKFKNVCIIGAGPAGSLSAVLLKQAGFEVTLVDRYEQAKRKVCGEYLCPLGVSLVHELDMHSLFDHFHPVYGMKVVSPYFTSFLSFFPEKDGVEYGMSVNRQIFDQRLRDMAEQAKVITEYGETFIDIKKNKAGWTVITQNWQRDFDLVLAADGINSKVAQILNHKSKVNTSRVALHAYVQVKNPRAFSRLGQMHILKDGSYVGVDPILPSEINISVVLDKQKLKGQDSRELLNSYIKKSPELKDNFELIKPDQTVSSAGCLKNKNNFIAGDGLAYVGDSAGFIDPLTGEGMYNALQSAQLITNCLIESPTNAGLLKYKKEKEKFFRQKNILNKFFQILIRIPWGAELVAKFLKVKQKRADIFIGIIGNIYKPVEGILKLIKA